MKTLTKTLLAAAALAGLGVGSVHASTVDLFTDPNPAQIVRDNNVGATGCAFGTVSGNGCFDQAGSFPGSILGGYRDIYVETIQKTFAPDPTPVPSFNGTQAVAGEGVFSYASDSGVDGYAKVQWDGNDNSAALDIDGLNTANLINQVGCGTIGCDRFVATVLRADFGFEYKLTVYDMDGSGTTLTANTLFAVSNPTGADYEFAWWNLADGDYFLGGLPFNIQQIAVGTTAGIDFTQIGALQLEINTSGDFDLDLSLDSITKTVPEPGALALVGAALIGVGAASRRRKSAVKA